MLTQETLDNAFDGIPETIEEMEDSISNPYISLSSKKQMMNLQQNGLIAVDRRSLIDIQQEMGVVNTRRNSMLCAIKCGWRPSIPNDCPKGAAEYINMMKRCWHNDPKKRPTFREIIEAFDDCEGTIQSFIYTPTK